MRKRYRVFQGTIAGTLVIIDRRLHAWYVIDVQSGATIDYGRNDRTPAGWRAYLREKEGE